MSRDGGRAIDAKSLWDVAAWTPDDGDAHGRAQHLLRLQHAALESAANGVLITDRSGVIQWANPAFCQMTGYATDEVVGRDLSFLKSG